jgi:hypothetical protein
MSQVVYTLKNIKQELIKVAYVIEHALKMTNKSGRNMSQN